MVHGSWFMDMTREGHRTCICIRIRISMINSILELCRKFVEGLHCILLLAPLCFCEPFCCDCGHGRYVHKCLDGAACGPKSVTRALILHSCQSLNHDMVHARGIRSLARLTRQETECYNSFRNLILGILEHLPMRDTAGLSPREKSKTSHS
jgi:hypothetical protein